MTQRLLNEIHHSAQIKHRAEEIWGWMTPAGHRRAHRRARYFIDLTGMSAAHRVLEIGCGTGIFSEKISRTGARIVATDASADLLELARKKSIGNCSFEEADATRLPCAGGTFDIVCGSSILHHLDLRPALAEIYRVLKSGGQAVFAEPNMMNPQILIQKNIPCVKKWMGESPDETAFFRWPLKRLLLRCGFSNVSVEPYDFLHPAFPAAFVPTLDNMLPLFERVPFFKEIAGSLIIYARKP
ncbi:MAG: methyltransferase domain-containing protein [Elusimicrobia bacterium]|nr:methyltransferase domain-containing protein [Elusimicrobiota bacterium]